MTKMGGVFEPRQFEVSRLGKRYKPNVDERGSVYWGVASLISELLLAVPDLSDVGRGREDVDGR